MQVAAKQFADLSGGAPGGHVDLKVGKIDGEIFVDGKEAGKVVKGVGSLELPLGAHTIVVKARGYEDMETKVEVSCARARPSLLSPLSSRPGRRTRRSSASPRSASAPWLRASPPTRACA